MTVCTVQFNIVQYFNHLMKENVHEILCSKHKDIPDTLHTHVHLQSMKRFKLPSPSS